MSHTDSPADTQASGGAQTSGEFAAWRFDDPYSERLVASMAQGWGTLPATATPVAPPPELLRRRRDALRAELGGAEPALVTSGRAPSRNDDQVHPVRAASDYVWLTGDQTAGGVFVLDPDSVDGDVLYLDVLEGRTGTEFFSDAARGELWIGPQPSLEDREQAFGVRCRPVTELNRRMCALAGAIVSGPPEPAIGALRDQQPPELHDQRRLPALISELRLIKDEWELAQLRQAIEVTIEAFGDVRSMMRGRSSVGEREVEVAFNARARRDGNGPGYHVIAAGGAHATILHWTRNDALIPEGELLLLDAGVEVASLYTGDLTRTWPISGRFDPVQRRIYESVLAAEKAAIATLRPGARFRDYYEASARELAGALAELGVLGVDPEESLQPDCGLHRRFTLCGPGHMLGLDVHDCSAAREERYIGGRLQAGMVLTVEPGLYFQANDESIPRELRGMGVRVEDDVLITEDGFEVLSRRLPREVDEIEAWCLS